MLLVLVGCCWFTAPYKTILVAFASKTLSAPAYAYGGLLLGLEALGVITQVCVKGVTFLKPTIS